jgi:hypothetical protein
MTKAVVVHFVPSTPENISLKYNTVKGKGKGKFCLRPRRPREEAEE